MSTFAAMRELDVWYAQTPIDEELDASLDPKYAKAIHRTAVKARARDNLGAVSKLTRLVDGAPPADQRSATARADQRTRWRGGSTAVRTAHGGPHRRLSR